MVYDSVNWTFSAPYMLYILVLIGLFHLVHYFLSNVLWLCCTLSRILEASILRVVHFLHYLASCCKSCLVVSCLVFSCLVLSRVLSCLVVSCLVFSCLVLSRVLSCLVVSCLLWSCRALSCLGLSCLVNTYLFRRYSMPVFKPKGWTKKHAMSAVQSTKNDKSTIPKVTTWEGRGMFLWSSLTSS